MNDAQLTIFDFFDLQATCINGFQNMECLFDPTIKCPNMTSKRLVWQSRKENWRNQDHYVAILATRKRGEKDPCCY